MDIYWIVIYCYCGPGIVVALAFVLFGIDRIDDAAHGAFLVRPLLMPGLILLWPLVLVRWVMLERRKRSAQ